MWPVGRFAAITYEARLCVEAKKPYIHIFIFRGEDKDGSWPPPLCAGMWDGRPPSAAFVRWTGNEGGEGPEITVTGATRLKSKHTILPPDTKIVTSSNLASGPFSYHPQHRSQRRRHEKGSRSASG